MKSLCDFNFYALSVLDGEKEEINLNVKGYKSIENDKKVYYFKKDNSYKFIVDENLLVYVNDSIYHFNINKKTEALIRVENYSYKVSVITNKLDINDDYIELEYILDFVTFKGEYKIILKLL